MHALDLLDQLVRRADAGEAVAACVLVAARGSTPQKPPAVLLVLADGRTLGTIGGGCVEAEVRVRALRLLAGVGVSAGAGATAAADPATGPTPARLHSFKLDHDLGWDDGLVCGGTMDVAVIVVRSAADAAPFRSARDALAAGEPATLDIDSTDEQDRPATFSLPLDPRPALFVAGAGHVGQALAPIAAGAGFDVTVVDDRPDMVTPDRFPAATRVVGDIEAELRRLPVGANGYVVIVTRGHRNDAAALAAALATPARYVGLIGSRRKVVTILRDLRAHGLSAETLRRVHAPIGLDIGAVDPGEIAVSIAAELIAVRRGQAGKPAGAMRLSGAALEQVLGGEAGSE
ncbi:MAG TPA: XdhC family protein [Humisphaera sp.]